MKSVCTRKRKILHKLTSVVDIHATLIATNETMLLLISTNRGQTSKRFAKVCVQRRASNCIETLELARAAAIHGLCAVVHVHDGKERNQEPRGHDGDEGKSEDSGDEQRGCGAECIGQRGINNILFETNKSFAIDEFLLSQLK